MLKMDSKKLLDATEYVREPVDNICKKIENHMSTKIILNSGRGTGKSVVLYNLENRGIGQERQFMYTRFDSIVIFHGMPNQYFDEQFMNHYYELTLCNKILNYIEKYYSFTYQNNFKDLEKIIKQIGEDTDKYIRDIYWKNDTKLIKILKPMELSFVIIDRLKNCLNISLLGISIDRFDSVHGGSELAQNIISNFFSMFDKAVIVADDATLQEESNKNKLLERGYIFTDIDYGNDNDIIKEIIRKRIQLHNKLQGTGVRVVAEDFFTEDIYQALISKTNGNISLMLDIVREMMIQWQWKNGKYFDLKKEFAIASEERLSQEKQLKKMIKPSRLYL